MGPLRAYLAGLQGHQTLYAIYVCTAAAAATSKSQGHITGGVWPRSWQLASRLPAGQIAIRFFSMFSPFVSWPEFPVLIVRLGGKYTHTIGQHQSKLEKNSNFFQNRPQSTLRAYFRLHWQSGSRQSDSAASRFWASHRTALSRSSNTARASTRSPSEIFAYQSV